MTTIEKCNYPPGSWIWVPDAEIVWRKAEVLECLPNGNIEVKIPEFGATAIIESKSPTYVCNMDIVQNNHLEHLDDLTQLTHLHEPAVLNSLNLRFDIDNIYTFTGPILLAVNPFKPIKKLYDLSTIKQYIDGVFNETGTHKNPPHVFATGSAAYYALCHSKRSQTILISGESGAGKTESTKFVMKLLALAGSEDWTNRSQIESQVLQSNPLLESLGNAKTLRNHNSSRFGKFIEMQFMLSPKYGQEDYIGRLAGACIHTYLLETVRVCQQMEGERNYHIFYQLCAAAEYSKTQSGIYQFPSLIKEKIGGGYPCEFNLSQLQSFDHFRYLTKSSCSRLNHVNDMEEFEFTILAMQTIGISFEEQVNLFHVIGAVLYLGNVMFEPLEGESETSCLCEASRKAFKSVCNLIGVSEITLENALTTRTIKAAGEEYKKPLLPREAEDARDALAKALYGTAFLKLVKDTNGSIGYRDDVKLFCGVLDIFGFECFQYNSFEQLCINYTNERLQQFFNSFVFKCEAELYKKEGISWSPLDFPDNQNCVDLLEQKTTGIFSMLDEECIVPKGSDNGFCHKIKQAHKTHPRFDIIKTQAEWFIICHFAGPVKYCVDGFLEKNRDQLSLDVQNCVIGSTNHFVQNLFQEFLSRGGGVDSGNTASVAKKKRLVTVSSEFRHQLNYLMESVSATDPHFIRCIKPNPQNLPNEFERRTVTEQLRYGGALQAVQVSRAGYPVRLLHFEAWLDYRCLCDKNIILDLLGENNVTNYRSHVMVIMTHLDKKLEFPKPIYSPNSWAVGETMVFFKQESYSILAEARAHLRVRMAIYIQSRWHGALQRKYFLHIKACTTIIQAFVRGRQERKRFYLRKQDRAVRILQRNARKFLARRRFIHMRQHVIALQSAWRAFKAKQAQFQLKQNNMAIRIQSRWKGRVQRRKFIALRHAVLLAQRRWKMILAKRTLKLLRQKQREIGSIMEQKLKLETDNLQLLSNLETLQNQFLPITTERDNLLQQVQQLIIERDTLSNDIGTISLERDQLLKQVEDVMTERDTLSNDMKSMASEKEEHSEQMQQLIIERDTLSNDIGTISLERDQLLKQVEDVMTERDTLSNDMKTMALEKEEHSEQMQQLIIERDTLSNDIGTISLERDQLLKQVEDVMTERHQLSEKVKDLTIQLPTKQQDVVNRLAVTKQNECMTICPSSQDTYTPSVSGSVFSLGQSDTLKSPSNLYVESLGSPSPISMPSVSGQDHSMTGDKQLTSHKEAEIQIIGTPLEESPLISNDLSRPGNDSQLSESTPIDPVLTIDELRVKMHHLEQELEKQQLMNIELKEQNDQLMINKMDSPFDSSIQSFKQIDDILHESSGYYVPQTFDTSLNKDILIELFVLGDIKSQRVTIVRQFVDHCIDPKYDTALHTEPGLLSYRILFKGVRFTLHEWNNTNIQHEDFLKNDHLILKQYIDRCRYIIIFYDPSDKQSIHEAIFYAKLAKSERVLFCRNLVSAGFLSEQEKNDRLLNIQQYLPEHTYRQIDTDDLYDAMNELFVPEPMEMDSNHHFGTHTLHSSFTPSPKVNIRAINSSTTRFMLPTSVSGIMNQLYNFFGGPDKQRLQFNHQILWPSITDTTQQISEQLSSNKQHSMTNKFTFTEHHFNQSTSGSLRPVLELSNHQAAVTCLAFGSQRNNDEFYLLAVCCDDGSSTVYQIYRTPLEKELYYKRYNKSFHRWDNNNNNKLTVSSNQFNVQQSSNNSLSTIIRSSSHVGSIDGTGQRITLYSRLVGHGRTITHAVFNNDGTRLVTASLDKTIRFWDISTGHIVRQFSDSSACFVVEFIPFNPLWLISSNSAGILRVFDSSTGKIIQRFGGQYTVRALTFDNSGLYCFAGTIDGHISVLEINQLGQLNTQFTESITKNSITSVTFASPPGIHSIPCLLINSHDSFITIMDCHYAHPTGTLTSLTIRQRVNIVQHDVTLHSCYSPAGEGWLLSGSEDNQIYVVSLHANSTYSPMTLTRHKSPVCTLAINDDTTVLASGDSSGKIILWRWCSFKHDL